MFLIIVVIVVPGYFIVSRISKTLYSGNSKMDKATEKRYGFQRLENEINEAKETAENSPEEAVEKSEADHKENEQDFENNEK
ncbi:hypothetical protein GH810_02690 [Acetobacterium paludosum]|uniref:Uncharacterized protein n=1 Tax=Acetobacterium paludosum TaxID=52693 RepID=A0A923HWG8_9FIRM|nr:hypothetical protein [Acetobacterium paludosum]MBC3887216.1 hypothetical protein [Acetobacterium paludosum]